MGFRRTAVASAVATVIGLSTAVWAADGVPGSASGDAKATAGMFRSASSVDQAVRALNGLLTKLSVPVISPSSTADPAGLYPYELDMIADAYMRGVLLPLDDLATLWRTSGMTSPVAANGQLTGLTVENALRQLRLRAETKPADPQGYLICLIDELGKRKEHPFSLLQTGEPVVPGGPSGNPQRSDGPQAPMLGDSSASLDRADFDLLEADQAAFQAGTDDSIAEAMVGAEASGDTEFLGMLQGLKGTNAFGSMMGMTGPPKSGLTSSPKSGMGLDSLPPELLSMISPYLNQAYAAAGVSSAEELTAKMNQANQAALNAVRGASAPSDATPEDRAAFDSAKAIQETALSLKPGKDSSDQALKLSRQRVEQVKALAAATKSKSDRDSQKRRRELQQSDADALAVFSLGADEDNAWLADVDLAMQVSSSEIAYREVEEQQREIQWEQTDNQTRGPVGLPTAKPTSEIYLDPIQVMLVQLDLFDLAKAPALALAGLEGGKSK